MNWFKRKMMFTVVAASLALMPISAVQAIDSPLIIDNVPNIIGVGGGMYPDYFGSDDYTGGAAPFFRWTLKGQDRYLQLNVTELTFNILNNSNFELGPVLNYRFGRDDDVEDKKVRRMDEVDGTVDAGIFGAYVWQEQGNPRHRFTTQASFLSDVGDVYRGWIATGSVRYWYPISKPVDILIGLGTNYGNSQYMDTYFGVNSHSARMSGLNRFDADAGFRDVNLSAALVVHFSENWHMGVGFKYFRLLSDAADSPIVEDRGSEDQIIGGVGFAYSW
jgi:outer membrane protein